MPLDRVGLRALILTLAFAAPWILYAWLAVGPPWGELDWGVALWILAYGILFYAAVGSLVVATLTRNVGWMALGSGALGLLAGSTAWLLVDPYR